MAEGGSVRYPLTVLSARLLVGGRRRRCRRRGLRRRQHEGIVSRHEGVAQEVHHVPALLLAQLALERGHVLLLLVYGDPLADPSEDCAIGVVGDVVDEGRRRESEVGGGRAVASALRAVADPAVLLEEPPAGRERFVR